jgi:hypothetical protein
MCLSLFKQFAAIVVVSDNGGFMNQGELKVWRNVDKQEIVVLVTNVENSGVVVHSDNLISIGTVIDLNSMDLTSFIGTVNMVSKETK